MDFIRYTIWPFVKVKAIYFWWIIKYGGKKNIPPELIFKQMEKSARRMNENLMEALRSMPSDATDEEKSQLVDLLRQASSFEGEIKKLKR